MRVINSLVGLALNSDQEDYLDALSTFVEIYEDEHIEPPAKIPPREMLRVVCAETNTTQTKIAEVLRVSEGLISLLLKASGRLR